MDVEEHITTPLTAILELSRLVCSTLEFGEVFERILESVQKLSGADVLAIMLLDEDQQNLSITAIRGLDVDTMVKFRFSLDKSIVGWAVKHNEALCVVDPQRDPRYQYTNGLDYGVLYAVPLRAPGRVLGCLSISRLHERQPFSEHVCQMVEVFASHAAIAIENAVTARELQISAARERIHALRSIHYQEGALLIEEILAELGNALAARACRLEIVRHQEVTRSYEWNAHSVAHTTYSVTEAAQMDDELTIRLSVMVDQNLPYHQRVNRELTRFVAEQVAQLVRSDEQRLVEQQRRVLDDILLQIGMASHVLVGEEHALETILDRLAEFIAYDSAGVFVYHNDRYARLAGGRGYSRAGVDVVLDMGPGSLPWQIHQLGRAYYVPDVQILPQWQNVPDADIVRSWIGVPLLVGETMIGLLVIDRWTPNAFGANDVAIAERFGKHLALAIRNARLVQEAQERANQLQVLHRLAVQIGAIRDEQELFITVARLIQRTFGYYQVVVGTVENNDLVMQAAFGVVNDQREFEELQRYSVQRGITGLAVRNAETVLVNNVLQHEQYAAVASLQHTRAELVVPIKSEGEVLGVIDIESDLIGAFGEQDVQVAEALAGQIGIALSNIRRYRQLERTQSHLAHSERLRALGELSSGIAHDFNNLLTSILGHTQLMLQRIDNPKIRDELEIIERAAFDGAATVRRLQSFAQIHQPLPYEPVDLNAIIDESLAITRPRWRDSLQSQGAQISIHHELGQIPYFLGDQAALRDMVTNLILNAVDAMVDGGTLTIRTRHVTASHAADELVILEVSDTGRGIAPDVLPNIFMPFFSTKGARGTGMGLAMVRGTVERHGGTISVESVLDQGSSFMIMLPVQQIEQSVQAVPALPNARTTVALHILVVEDDPAVQRVLTQLLRRVGHQVSLAENGDRALELLQANRYDIVCSDLGLPGMSGWEVILAARRYWPNIATVLITGWGNQITLDEARARGVDALIAKPFDVAELRQVIETVTQTKR